MTDNSFCQFCINYEPGKAPAAYNGPTCQGSNNNCNTCAFYGWPCLNCAEFHVGRYGPGYIEKNTRAIISTIPDNIKENMQKWMQNNPNVNVKFVDKV